MITEQEQAQNAIKWIDGLAETELPQGNGELGDEHNGYCCLGYGCVVLGIPFVSTNSNSKYLMNAIGMMDADGSFFEYTDIEKTEKVITGHIIGGEPMSQAVYSLIDLNDSVGYSFKQISEYIKNNLEEIFYPVVAQKIREHYENIKEDNNENNT